MIEIIELGPTIADILECKVSGLDFMYIFTTFSRLLCW